MNNLKDFKRFTEYYKTWDEGSKWYKERACPRRLKEDLPYIKEGAI